LGTFVDVDRQQLVAHLRAGLGHEGIAGVGGRDVHQASVRVEGHRVPAVRAGKGRRDVGTGAAVRAEPMEGRGRSGQGTTGGKDGWNTGSRNYLNETTWSWHNEHE